MQRPEETQQHSFTVGKPGLEAEQPTITIGLAAAALGVSPHWLRLSERLGSIPLARRDEQGWRRYSDEDLEALRALGVGARKARLAAKQGPRT